MRRTISILLAIAALCFVSCRQEEVVKPTMAIAVSEISSTGFTVETTLSDVAVAYHMVLIPAAEFSDAGALSALEGGAQYKVEKRRYERLHGARDYVVAARPVDSEGQFGEMVRESVTLGEFSAQVTLYTPGDDLGSTLNKYNTLNVMAFSNGIAAAGRCALAVSTVWLPLKNSKGIESAAEEVFSNSYITISKQQLEEMANPSSIKPDLMFFDALEAGTDYTFVICLEELDGTTHYYDFNGATKPLPEE